MLATRQRVAQSARHPLAAERLGSRDSVRIEDERGRPARDELGDPAQRISVSQCALELGVDDRVEWRGPRRPLSPTGCWRSASVQPAP
ncbi:MAG TPA: hypothetical protein VFY45_17435 [Baekduia sp.]|jgi:hypothetical protein|nr:hypothetical protein [Baekduia sp.]